MANINITAPGDELGKGNQRWVRVVNTIVSSLMLAPTHAARSSVFLFTPARRGVRQRTAIGIRGQRDDDHVDDHRDLLRQAGRQPAERGMFLVWLAVIWADRSATGAVGIMARPLQVCSG